MHSQTAEEWDAQRIYAVTQYSEESWQECKRRQHRNCDHYSTTNTQGTHDIDANQKQTTEADHDDQAAKENRFAGSCYCPAGGIADTAPCSQFIAEARIMKRL
jgi:hypothetical protein